MSTLTRSEVLEALHLLGVNPYGTCEVRIGVNTVTITKYATHNGHPPPKRMRHRHRNRNDKYNRVVIVAPALFYTL